LFTEPARRLWHVGFHCFYTIARYMAQLPYCVKNKLVQEKYEQSRRFAEQVFKQTVSQEKKGKNYPSFGGCQKEELT
jgi:hypothetical protein